MKSFYQKIDNICNNKYFFWFYLPISFCFLLIYSYTTSPLYVYEGADSAVFKTMGLAIIHGKIPYLDIFDHKGPVLYFINALGQYIIPGRIGVFLLQILGLFISLVYFFKTAKLFVKSFIAFIYVLIILFVYGGVIQEGNQCEEWMMIFFSISFYLIMKYIWQNNKKTHYWFYSFIYGLCFGFTFFIRPNDAVAQLGGIMIGLSIYLIRNKLYKNLLQNIVSFIGGFIIILVPILFYFSYNNALVDLFYGLIGFNSEYAGGVQYIFQSLFDEKKNTLLLLFINLCIIVSIKKKDILYIIIPILFFQILLLGRNYFNHYYIVFLPYILLYVIFAFKLEDRKYKVITLVILFFSTIYSGNNTIFKTASTAILTRYQMICNNPNMESFYKETDRLLSMIPIEERNAVWNHNLMWYEKPNFSCLLHFGIIQCNVITFCTSNRLEERDNIKKTQPTWVVAENHEDNWRNNMFHLDKELSDLYECVATTDSTIANIELYRLKR